MFQSVIYQIRLLLPVIGWEGRCLKEIITKNSRRFSLLNRLPFIENTEYIEIRQKIIKALVQIRILLRNFRLVDQINISKPKLILEVNEQEIYRSIRMNNFISRSTICEQQQSP